MKKISVKEAMEVIRNWRGGKYPGQRLGEAFLNEKFPQERDGTLLYSPNIDKVIDKILREYTDMPEELPPLGVPGLECEDD